MSAFAGEDVQRGQVVLTRGRKLGSSEIGMLAALNVERVSVHRRPRIGILSTGDEVVDLGRKLESGQIRDANGYALAARVAELGGVPVRLGIAVDTKRDLSERLRAANGCDLILTSGGVSVGDFDLVKDVLQAGRSGRYSDRTNETWKATCDRRSWRRAIHRPPGQSGGRACLVRSVRSPGYLEDARVWQSQSADSAGRTSDFDRQSWTSAALRARNSLLCGR